jgi:hypothetical protein
MVVLVARRIRVGVEGPLPKPLFFTVTVTENDAPGFPLVGLAVTLVTMKSGSCVTAATVNGVVR